MFVEILSKKAAFCFAYNFLADDAAGWMQFLEESSIWSRVVRLAGSGTGALIATLLTLGYTSQQLEQLLSFNIRKLTRGMELCLNLDKPLQPKI